MTPQIVGSNVYAHIRSMAKATVPAYLISLVLFFLIGQLREITAPPVDPTEALGALASHLQHHPVVFAADPRAAPAGYPQVPGFPLDPDRYAGRRPGSCVRQQQVVMNFANDPSLGVVLASLKSVWMAMANGFALSSRVCRDR